MLSYDTKIFFLYFGLRSFFLGCIVYFIFVNFIDWGLSFLFLRAETFFLGCFNFLVFTWIFPKSILIIQSSVVIDWSFLVKTNWRWKEKLEFTLPFFITKSCFNVVPPRTNFLILFVLSFCFFYLLVVVVSAMMNIRGDSLDNFFLCWFFDTFRGNMSLNVVNEGRKSSILFLWDWFGLDIFTLLNWWKFSCIYLKTSLIHLRFPFSEFRQVPFHLWYPIYHWSCYVSFPSVFILFDLWESVDPVLFCIYMGL